MKTLLKTLIFGAPCRKEVVSHPVTALVWGSFVATSVVGYSIIFLILIHFLLSISITYISLILVRA